MPSEPTLSAILHELRAPLVAIRGYGELLADRADEETRLAASARLLEAADRLSASLDALESALDGGGAALDELARRWSPGDERAG